jgi:hypothetical protein
MDNYISYPKDTPEQHQPSEQPDECSADNLEALVDLKFAVERQFSIMLETFKKTKDHRLVNRTADLDIYAAFALFNNNIEMYGQIFLEKQTELIGSIDAVLMKKCDHNWIHDVIDEPLTSRNICYCGKCYCRQV